MKYFFMEGELMKKILLCTFLSLIFVYAFSQTRSQTLNSSASINSSLSNLKTDTPAVELRFKYSKGDLYRILSTVNEDVFVNRRYDHKATIVNRVTCEVTDVEKDGSGVHDAVFMTSEDSTSMLSSSALHYGEEYKSVFTRSPKGVYNISDTYFMPTVRDVPSFPENKVKPGDTWKASGHEGHDLRKHFNIEKPFIVPFEADYKYLGVDPESNLHVINVRYTMKLVSPLSIDEFYLQNVPVTTIGYSDEYIFFDNEKGCIDHYSEVFRILIQTTSGNLFEFSGTAHAEITEFERSNTKDNLASVEKSIKDSGIENVSVKSSDKGLVISLENIKFKADSSLLLDSEKQKLDMIGKILQKFPNNDILVTGHTALAGSKRERQKLSEERAEAVADYFVKEKVRDRYHIFTQGFGAAVPVASNDTEEGMAKNRRVEIIILDK